MKDLTDLIGSLLSQKEFLKLVHVWGIHLYKKHTNCYSPRINMYTLSKYISNVENFFAEIFCTVYWLVIIKGCWRDLGTFLLLVVLSGYLLFLHLLKVVAATLLVKRKACCGWKLSKRQYCMIVLLVKPMLTAAAVSAILLPARFSKVNIMLGKLVQSTPA